MKKEMHSLLKTQSFQGLHFTITGFDITSNTVRIEDENKIIIAPLNIFENALNKSYCPFKQSDKKYVVFPKSFYMTWNLPEQIMFLSDKNTKS